ncbi:hypothetical protein KGP26_10610 [Serratia sp. JSRIV002]|uniref:hypothetical protein n=1 Tax=Serratia sp. JSRIV002 TaxID=2831894 RepID=UPI001CBDD1AB|nr:hypothetical protein [Serratia sp. JSRIV002]UAN53471.1 hypothetical protein KGP26_10610 [Serratia sp. JSRIV002]
MKNSFIKIILFTCPFYAMASDDIPYDFPTDGEMANSLKTNIISAPPTVNNSIRVTRLEVTEEEISVLIKAGVIDTSKPKDESLIPDEKAVALTKASIINKYCAPFGFGDLYFDAYRKRKTKLNYYFYGAGDVPLFSFTVSTKDCST